ncbi:hypothetical protein [Bradyrhizobium australafricanum]
MLARFMATDRGFSKLKREVHVPAAGEGK